MSDLQRVIGLIKAGQKAEARSILVQILKDDPDNEKAWLAMASCAANKSQLATSVTNVLRINPQNATALKLAERYNVPIPDQTGASLSQPLTGDDEPDIDPYPTEPSSPTMPMRSDTVRQAMQELNDVLSQPSPRPLAVIELDDDDHDVEADLPDEDKGRRRGLLRLWLLALIAIVIVGGVVLLFLDEDRQQEADVSGTWTAEASTGTSMVIAQTNVAVERDAQATATAFTGTETAVYLTEAAIASATNAAGTQIALNATSTAAVPPTRTPASYIQAANIVAVITDANPPVIEPRDTFALDEVVSVEVLLASGNETLHIEVELWRVDDNEEMETQQQQAALDTFTSALFFNFVPANDTWDVGDYRVDVYAEGEPALSASFTIAESSQEAE